MKALPSTIRIPLSKACKFAPQFVRDDFIWDYYSLVYSPKYHFPIDLVRRLKLIFSKSLTSIFRLILEQQLLLPELLPLPQI